MGKERRLRSRRYAGFAMLVMIAFSVGAILLFPEAVASFMRGIADWLFLQFEDDAFPLVLAAAILAIFAVMLLAYLLFIVWPIAIALRSARKFVESHDERSFAKNFHEVSQRLESDWLIGHAYSEFRETLVEPKHDDDIVQNTTRPHTFINYNCALDKSTALRLMPHIPNYFVGVGLLLTFVGLVAALFFANNSVGGDASEAVEGLRNLLAAATFKFWTSIAGLLSSIALSISFRFYTLWIEGGFVELCETIEERLGFATPQRIFFDVRDNIEEQLSEIKKFNTEVAMSVADGIGNVFREQVPAMLADAMRPLVDAVQESSDKVREGATGGLQNMVDSFTETLEGSSGQHLKQMSATLAQLTGTLEAMQGAMNSSGDDFSRRMAEGAERLDSTMREVADSMQALAEGLKLQLGEAGLSFGSSLQDSLARLSNQSEEMGRQLAAQSRDASTAFSDEVAKAARALADSANENAESSANFAQQLRETLGQSVDGVHGALDRVGNSLTSLQGQLERQGSAMSVVSERGQETARSLESVSRSINSGLEPFQRVGQSMSESASLLERSVLSMATKIDGTATIVESLSKDLSAVSTALQSAWNSYKERFEAVDEDLERAFTQLQEAVENQQGIAQKFVRDLDGSFTRALSGLAGGIDGMRESIEYLSDALESADGKQGVSRVKT